VSRHVPACVADKEPCKRTPATVSEYAARPDVRLAADAGPDVARIDRTECPDDRGGLLFVMPDRSAGPVSWTCCDNNADEVSPVQFGSKRGQHRGNTGRTERGRFGSRLTFLGPFDFSVRPWDRASEPEFVIPRTRFDQTQLAMRE